MIEIKNGKIFVDIEGKMKETTDPTLIGLAFLDMVEEAENLKSRQYINIHALCTH